MASPAVRARLAADLQRVADAESAGGHACILRVDVPQLGVVSRHASGNIAKHLADKATPDTPFRTASVTKTFTAACLMQLVAEGRTTLDAPVAAHLPPHILPVLDRLHVLDGTSHGRAITVRHCLAHSSGLFDYAMSKGFGRAVWADPAHAWTPTEMLEGAIAWGKPNFAPDMGKYAYNDTGYVLLGLAIEHLDSRPLHASYRARILGPLGLHATYLEGHEPHRGPPMAHPYSGDRDALEMHGTSDWAGGGLVSTVDDLSVFIRALLAGRVVPQPLLGEMLAYAFRAMDPAEVRPGTLGYGLGVYAREHGGVVLRGHTGFWGVVMYADPKTGLAVTGTINRTEPPDALVEKVVEAVKVAISKGGKEGEKL